MKGDLKTQISILICSGMILLFSSCTKDTVTLPSVTTSNITGITRTSAVSGGNVSDDGSASVVSRGVCWNTAGNPTTDDMRTIEGRDLGLFISNLSGLTPNTNYFVRAYATNEFGTGYGKQLSFTTIPIAGATVTTTLISSITSTSAVSGGNITSDGGGEVTSRGVCWSTSVNPTIDNSITSDGSGTGSFISNITGLVPGTSYYIRAYATNTAGTSYGELIYFSTYAVTSELTTSAVTSITSHTAISGGNIISDGGSEVTSRGICWSTRTSPTVADQKTEDGAGTGSFTSSITGLLSYTRYYVRAYAINRIGTSYGNEVSFTTASDLPTIITAPISDIRYRDAKSGGTITSDGGATVTTRGVCWSLSIDPTINDGKTEDGSGGGSFTSSISALSPNTTYYVRAYATNIAGTSYGMTFVFATIPTVIPVLETTVITSITQTTATGGGLISADGGETVTARGVCWSSTPDPTITDAHTTDGTGTGSYLSNLTGLTGGTIYYVRAYATNSVGTAYGKEITFTTEAVLLPVITTMVPSLITNSTAVSGGNITSDGGGPVTARGVCWSATANPTIIDAHTTDGTGTGSFVSSLTGLLPGIIYHIRAYATNSAGTVYGNDLIFTTLTGNK
jgi:hypothetical protein